MLDIDLEFPRSHESDIIVPTKAVTELQRLLTDDSDVKVSFGSGQIAFRSEQHAARLQADRR
jgi:DNA polymerase-3 subunit beta